MEPPLRERLHLRRPNPDGTAATTSSADMARVGAYLLAAGAALAALSIALPHNPEMREGLLVLAAALALALAAVLILVYDRMPLAGFHAATAAATALATLAVYAWSIDSAYGPLPYLWVTVFAFWFFPLRAALPHLALMAAGYALALVVEDPPYTPAGGWVATVGTLLIVGLPLATGRDRVVALIGSLTEAARRDPLTELLNRRGFEEAFDVELERARRSGAPLGIVVGDIDRLKRLNDELGHAAGDEALRRIARSLRAAKRTFDSGARIGGEEFAVLAPDCNEHGAYLLAERARGEVERAFARGPIPLTLSLGVATFPLHGQSAESLLRAADQALYAAKRLGRNRSVISSAEVPGILAGGPRARQEMKVDLTSLLTLAEALDVRDWGNATHCHRVGRFAELVARELGLPPDSVERVRLAGILHDVGRVGMPDTLLEKRESLSEEDWAWVRSHPEIGARMLETTAFDDIRRWVLFHHERPDGGGYPTGLSAEQVPLEARILAVADAYEAMTRDRPYRPALAAEEATAELRRAAGRQFDEQVVEALLRVV